MKRLAGDLYLDVYPQAGVNFLEMGSGGKFSRTMAVSNSEMRIIAWKLLSAAENLDAIEEPKKSN